MDTSISLLIPAGILLVTVIFAAAGVAAGRKASFARPLASYGTPAALLLTLAALFLWLRKTNLTGSNGYAPLIIILLFLAVPALLSAAAAVLCAFRPKKSSFVLAFTAGLIGAGLVFARIPFGLERGLVMYTGCGSYALALFFSCMGLALTGDVWKELGIEEDEPEPPEETGETPQAQPSGFLYLLAEPYGGEQLPLPDGEELRMGSDAAYCHLILGVPGMPPCVCGVRWLGQRNTYLVTCYALNGLLREDGRPLPGNSSVEARPGEVFLDGQTGQPLFQAG